MTLFHLSIKNLYTITLPGSKSITNRDLILSALSQTPSTLKGFLRSDDTKYMIQALKEIGIDIKEADNTLYINGGVQKINGAGKTLYLGNSGTSTRFLSALAVLNQKGSIIITGDERMLQRPIKDLIEGIQQLGVSVNSTNYCFPLEIVGGSITLSKVKMKGSSSSQYFTALLQIAPLLKNGLELEVIGDLVSKPYIDITINEMNKFGVSVTNNNYLSFKVKPQSYKGVDLVIEGDASALSYFAIYSALHGTEIKIDNIGKDTKQGDYNFLNAMNIFGLKYTNDDTSTIISSPGIKNINLQKYTNFEIDFEDMPDVSMSFMIMSIFLPGKTKITGLQTLNLKECLRIDAMRDELKKLGVEVTSDNTSITIGEYMPHNTNIDIDTYNDHRIAMCFGILNTYIGKLNILNPDCVNKTYPNFWIDLKKLNNN